MKKGNPKAIHLKDYQPPSFLIDRADLVFSLFEDHALVRSRLFLRRNEMAGRETNLLLDGEGLELIEVRLDGVELPKSRYAVEESTLSIVDPPDQFTLEISTRIRPQDNTSLEGLYRSAGNFCTQCEAQGFRRITYFLDRPDVLAIYTVRIEADKKACPVLLSNGDQVDQGPLNDGRHFATWRDPHPKPCYLFALVAGDLACKEGAHLTPSGRNVRLCIYTEHHNADKCDHALASLKKAMVWDEQRFGLEYDLDTYMIVAVDDFNMGAMENKGLNIFNSKFVLARPESATDDDYHAIEGVVAHEYFHNWTGNRVTCRDWFQLSLKEGLTVYRDQEFSADVFSSVKRIDDVRMLRTAQFAEDDGPMAHPVRPQSYIEINNFYTVTVYEKGAEVVRMYETLLGREGFRKGMDLYFKRHDGQAVTTDDFCAAMADANGADLHLFKRWYDQHGTPVVTATTHWEADTQRYHLRLAQHNPAVRAQTAKAPLHIPLRVALLDDNGARLPLTLEGESKSTGTETVLHLKNASQEFVFEGIAQEPHPSLLRGFSAPVRLEYTYTQPDLVFLFANDDDPFNRWEAGQRLMIDLIKQRIGDQTGLRRQQPLTPAVVAAFEQTLLDSRLELGFIAEALSLPGVTYLIDCFDQADIDGIHSARNFLRRELGTRLENHWLRVCRDCAPSGGDGAEYRYHPDDAGRRKLRGTALAFLCATEKPEHLDLAGQYYAQADNMSDSLAALRALNDVECPQRKQALADFERRWAHDPLVLDKWFALRAMSSLPKTLRAVEGLMKHAAFTIKNPNRVRALLGSFAQGNPVAFHQRSGDSYVFIADRVLEIDALNPQVAARLAKSFARWRKFDSARQVLMRAQLERMLASIKLSKDLYEVLSKSVA